MEIGMVMATTELNSKLAELKRLNEEIKSRIKRTESIREDVMKYMQKRGEDRINKAGITVTLHERVTYSLEKIDLVKNYICY